MTWAPSEMFGGSYMSPVSQAVQVNDPSSIHTCTRWIDYHGDRWADITAGAGHWVRLMKPDAHWDIILASCQKIKLKSPCWSRQNQMNRTESVFNAAGGEVKKQESPSKRTGRVPAR